MNRFLFVLIALLSVGARPAAAQEERVIVGQVIDAERNRPVVSATVSVMGSTHVVETGPEGRFRVTAPPGEVRLRISTIGYATREVTVPPEENDITISLQTDVLNLEGIVVTGQATSVARRNLANAVATVSADALERAPAESVEKQIQGKVPGALVETNSGAPGGGVQVRLRGVSTINGAHEPLYVVDGVLMSNVAIPSNANAVTQAAGGSNPALTQDAVVNRVVDLNPNDIESIEILKGASAAALYGSQAANGVILITTRRGTAGETRVNVTQRFGTFRNSEKIGFRDWTAEEAIDFFEDPTLAEYFNADGTPKQSFDHEELLANREELSYETTASISGGDQDTRYFVSGTWKNDEGIIANTGFEKQSLRVNLEQRIGERLQVNAHTNVIHTLASRGLTNNDNSGTSYYMVLPFTPKFVDLRPNAEGLYPDNPFERSNPLQTAALSVNDEDVWRMVAGASADLEVLNTGSHRVQLLSNAGVDFFNQENDLFFPPDLQFEDQDGLPGTSLLSNSDNLDLTLSGNAVHVYTAPSGLSATSTVGVQYHDHDLNIARIASFGLTAGQPNVDAGVVNNIREQRTRTKGLGFFAQEELLLLDDRLLLTAGLRADKSSTNGDPNEYFWYPKAAASYRFDDLADAIDGLKLRFAFGQSGNQPLFGQKFTPLTATTNIGGLPGLVVNGNAGDAGLTPERQTEFEGGFDLTLFDGAATLEATAFQKTTTDLLLQRTLAPSTGFALQIFNGGELRVRGLELGLAATPIRTDAFSWVSRTTFYRDRSEITELPVPAFETGGFGTSLGAYRIEKGASATQIVANAGLDADGNTIVAKVGDATPDFRFGFSNDFSWGPLSLFSLVDWSQGNSVINLTQFLADASGNSGDFVKNPQPFTLRDGTVVELGDGERRITRRGNLRDSRGYVEDGSYVKLREVALSYDLPEEWTSGLMPGLESARLTLSGRNVLTFTDYSGLDPEVSNFGNQSIARNIDVAPFPPSRSFWFAVDLTF